MSKILITGGAGFIGSHVVKSLVDRGDTVVSLDNFNNYYDPRLKEARINDFLKDYGFKMVRGDLTDKILLEKLFKENKFDKICHLAAQAGVRYSLENPDIYIQSNIIGTHNLLELARQYGVKNFIFASSSSVYGGNTKLPFSETDPVDRPVSLYAATKKANELEAYTYHHLYGLNCWGLRFFTVYGPWGRPDMAYFKFTEAIYNSKPIEIYNQGDMKRDFTYIDDIVSGILAAINRCSGYEIINLGNDNPVDLKFFIETIEKNTGRLAEKKYLPMQPGDIKVNHADIKKAKELLGWQPTVDIEKGISEFVKWFNNYYQK